MIGGASVRGAAHVRTGRPNQDAVKWSPPCGPGSRVVVAVSDGHGADAHFRSADGARLAVDQAVDLFAWHLDESENDEAEGGLAGEVARAWRKAVEADLSANPYPTQQRPGAGPRLAPYGATLLTLGANDSVMTMLQIGDGDLLLGYADGSLERPLRSDESLIGEETYSLCQDDAETRFRVASLWRESSKRWPDFAMLASDGVSKSFRDDSTFEDAIGRLRVLAATEWDAMIEALPDWLADVSAKGSGDDSSLCIVSRISPGATKTNGN